MHLGRPPVDTELGREFPGQWQVGERGDEDEPAVGQPTAAELSAGELVAPVSPSGRAATAAAMRRSRRRAMVIFMG